MKHILSSGWHAAKSVASWTWTFAKKHKIIAGIAVLVVLFAGYSAYAAIMKGKAGTEDSLAMVTQGPLTVTVSDSGQVSANHQLSLSPKASAEVTSVNVVAGQQVKAGQTIATLDMTDAQDAVTTARENLESAQISYQQTLTSSQNGTSNDQTSLSNATSNAVSSLTSAYAGVPTVMDGLKNVLYSLSTIANFSAEWNIDAYANYIDTATAQQDKLEAATAYQNATTAYQSAQTAYTAFDGSSATVVQTQQMLDTSISALQTINQAVRDALTYYNYIDGQIVSSNQSVPSGLSSQISSLSTYSTTLSNDISNLQSARSSLVSAQQSLSSDTQSLNGSSESLMLQSAQLSVQKAQDALTQALQNESDYIVTAPFDGTIASVSVKKYDQASSGTAVAVLITNDNYVDVSMNEADVAKVKVGQPASITFDAIDGLTIAGTVAEVDQVGTVSQGVVTYDVKIGFNSQDSRVKPGMTAEVTITTNSVADAIQVPSSAVHTVGNTSYVEVATLTGSSTIAAGAGKNAGGFGGNRMSSTTPRFRNASSTIGFSSSTTPSSSTAIVRTFAVPVSQVSVRNVPVTVGISSDTMTQITSGLKPGQFVVTGTTSGTAKSTTTGGGLFGARNNSTSAVRAGGGASVGGATIKPSGGATFRGGGGFGG